MMNLHLLSLPSLHLSPGTRSLLHNLSWHEFEAILEQRSDRPIPRLTYSQGTLELRMPTPEHEKIKILIGDFIKILLEEDDRDYEPLGSSTFKKANEVGLEPDDCFYIQNYATMVGKLRVNLAVDPPPDLAVEVDITSTTQLNVYRTIAVPELWVFSNGELKIFRFQPKSNDYTEAIASSIFETIPVQDIISQFVDRGLTAGVSQAKRELRKWLRDRTTKPT